MGLGDLEGFCWQVTFSTVPSLVFLQVYLLLPPASPAISGSAVSSPASCLSSAFVMLTLRTQGCQPHLDTQNIHQEAQLAGLRGEREREPTGWQ